ncbi:MAG: Ig-like domain-containing protein, partial [Gammaproteobacteria bacterium]
SSASTEVTLMVTLDNDGAIGGGGNIVLTISPTATHASGSYLVGSPSVLTIAVADAGGTGPVTPPPVTPPADTTPPTIMLSAGANSLTTGGTTTVNFTISETTTSFVVGDVTVSGGTLSGFTGSGTAYSVTFTAGSTATTATISVGAGRFTDMAGNGNTASSALTITVTDGVSEAMVQMLNETILPQVAVNMGQQSVQTLGTRADRAFAGNQAEGMSLRGGSLEQFLSGQAEQAIQRGMQGESGALQLDWPGIGIRDLSFDMAMNGGEDDGHRIGYTFWGRGYYSELSVDEGISFDSDITGGMIGVDALLTSNVLIGLSLNHAVAETDWNMVGEQATGSTHKTRFLGVHPYFGWQFSDDTRVWGSFGIGRGDIEITTEGVDLVERDMEMHTVNLGGYGTLWDSVNVNATTLVGIKADGIYTHTEETDSKTVQEAGWLRFGLVVNHNRGLENGGSFGSSLEVTYRGDFGDALTGSGMEASGGLDFFYPELGLRFDISGRALLVHDKDIDEWGIAGGIAWSPSSSGRGLSLAFKPQWGATGSDSQQLWDGGLSNFGSGADAVGRHSLELKYGIPVLRDRELLTLFARSSLQSNATLGTDLKLGKYFSTGYEAVMETETDHRGYIRYQKGF